MSEDGILREINVFAMGNATYKKNLRFIGGLVALGIIVVVGAVLLGKSDQGEINVSATIATSNSKAVERGEKPIPERPPYADLPNGGLVGKGKTDTPTPPPPVVEDTATSTESGTSSPENTDETTEPSTEEESVATDVSGE